ncbi:hypothetical protein SSBR45G_66050 [Bradyrhizobium sp. SSBR45G]|uniref:hypothetical protein n=1 Tax=unclassified Bradyrhizobium TaxID=2631580 RepID=UPI002342AFAF|nr:MULTISPECIES: hypothetical protein [unclassified Bradyrhizobium]GLH81696.1 hypothetical protein SSBR45G_66050 [Bradyrhizobium sp. SSBR45G]GLH89118.1 hypothetical protein SSBR45R_65790 [Bradyrhizobium sp. SSBR45R]
MSAEVIAQKWAGSAAGLFAGFVAWMTAGNTGIAHLNELLASLVTSTWLTFYFRYFGMLEASAEPKAVIGSSRARRDYDALRGDLAAGGDFSRLYARLLSRALNVTDRFIGDDKEPNESLSNRFGLKPAVPLWTTTSFDTCLVLALVYPIATVFFFWALTGHVGPAEAALKLRSDLSDVERAVAFLTVLLQVWAMNRYVKTKSFWWAALAFFVAVGLAVSVSVAAAGAIGLAQGAYFGPGVPLAGGVALGAAWIVAFTVATAFTSRDLWATFSASFVAVTFAAIMFGNRAIAADRRTMKQIYLVLLVPCSIAICLGASYYMANFTVWRVVGPLLLFGALMTVLNAPFDWASLGLTRVLLRSGLERGGWFPLTFAIVDAIAATFLIALLVPVMVVGVQFFDRIAEHAGGVAILPLANFFDGLQANPAAPEFWWAYALLLSTMLPSMFNLCIGGFSIVRVILARLSLFILDRLPADGPVVSYDRPWIATCLTVQVVGGVLFGFIIQALFALVVFAYVLPPIGLELLHIARWTASLNLPALFGLP